MGVRRLSWPYPWLCSGKLDDRFWTLSQPITIFSAGWSAMKIFYPSMGTAGLYQATYIKTDVPTMSAYAFGLLVRKVIPWITVLQTYHRKDLALCFPKSNGCFICFEDCCIAHPAGRLFWAFIQTNITSKQARWFAQSIFPYGEYAFTLNFFTGLPGTIPYIVEDSWANPRIINGILWSAYPPIWTHPSTNSSGMKRWIPMINIHPPICQQIDLQRNYRKHPINPIQC